MSTTTPPAQALTFDEALARLAVGRTTLFRLIETGELPSVKIGRSRRFLAEDVDAFLRERRSGAA